MLGIALVDRPPWTGRCRRQHLLGVGWAHQLNGRSMGGNMTTEHHTATSYLSGPSPRRRGAPMPVVGADEQILRPHRCTRRAPVRAGECSRGVRRRRPGTPGPGPCASGGHGQVHQEEALGVGGCWGKSPPARGGPSPPARGTSAKALPGRAPKASPREHRVRRRPSPCLPSREGFVQVEHRATDPHHVTASRRTGSQFVLPPRNVPSMSCVTAETGPLFQHRDPAGGQRPGLSASGARADRAGRRRSRPPGPGLRVTPPEGSRRRACAQERGVLR